MTFANRLTYALLLSVSFWVAEGLRIGHWLLHEKHNHRAFPCSARYDKNRAHHLHDERYSIDDCWICAFWFAIPDLPVAEPYLVTVSAEAEDISPIFLDAYVAILPPLRRSRAPPVAPSGNQLLTLAVL